MPDIDPVEYAQLCVHAMYTRGGLWLLCKPEDKSPLRGRRWRDQQVDDDTLYDHVANGGLPGLVPFSVGYSVIDVDAGDDGLLDTLEGIAPPAMSTRSRRPGGRHWWFRDNRPRGNRKFRICANRVSGEIRSQNGYVVLWPDAARQFNANTHNPAAMDYETACRDYLWIDSPALTDPTHVTPPKPFVPPPPPTRATPAPPAGAGWQEVIINLDRDRILAALWSQTAHSVDDYTDWISVGMALHHAALSAKLTMDESYTAWVEWSAQSAKFKGVEDCAKHWRSFGTPNSPPITAASLFI